MTPPPKPKPPRPPVPWWSNCIILPGGHAPGQILWPPDDDEAEEAEGQ